MSPVTSRGLHGGQCHDIAARVRPVVDEVPSGNKCGAERDRILASEISLRILTLQDAVRQIRLTAQSNPKAFFFMAGAGISYPEVPLAGGIVEHCRKRIGDAGPQAPGSPMARYAQCFEDAYPGPADRQKYLRGIIEGKQVSQANLRLAHLLISAKLPKLVVTTNFDDFLSRALTLF